MTESTAQSIPSIDESDRVRSNSSPEANRRLDEEMIERVRYMAAQSDDILTARIEALEREWDIERWLETNASVIALKGVALGALFSRKWLIIPFVVAGFLLQHAIQGWCPPLMVFRALGVRTRREIEAEKYALRILRGDYLGAATTGSPAQRADEALRLVGIS